MTEKKDYRFTQIMSALTIPTGNLYQNDSTIEINVESDNNVPNVHIKQQPRVLSKEYPLDCFIQQLDEIKKSLEFQYENFELKRLLNASQVLNSWKKLVPELKKKFKKEKQILKSIQCVEEFASAPFFDQSIRKSFPYQLLFYGLDLQELRKEKTIHSYQEISDFMTGISIPVKVEASIVENKESTKEEIEVKIRGEYAEDEEVELKLRERVKGLLGRPNVASIPAIRYVGKMSFDEANWPIEGGVFYTAGIQGLLQKECFQSFKRN